MTYEKAINALIGERLINSESAATAVEALKDHSVMFNYLDWAKALAEAGVLATMDVDKATLVMQEAEEDGEEFEKALRTTGIF